MSAEIPEDDRWSEGYLLRLLADVDAVAVLDLFYGYFEDGSFIGGDLPALVARNRHFFEHPEPVYELARKLDDLRYPRQ